ncbi:tol-pal system YbgF family protein [Nocardiopsis sediminis]|uniref:Tol-pal system YbgF family protein n=1 Tax=Nocardiopsis sediminis TaxID=1778267 RepID=A0ABV8FJI1_9ACTN
MADQSASNTRLIRLQREAGLSGEELARKVNAAGREMGVSLRYSRASVSQWRSGTRPRPPVPGLIAEVLSRSLGRSITAADAGFPQGGGAVSSGDDPLDSLDALARLDRTGGASPEDHGHSEHVFTLHGLVAPAWHPRTVSPAPHGRGPHPMRIGQSEIDAADEMLAVFSKAEALHGASRVAPLLRDYLQRTMAFWLRCPAGADTRRRLLRTAAHLAYLCGFAYFDLEEHGLAQRFYRISLLLAAEGDDAWGYAVALRAMSVQAFHLGHHGHALDLSSAAVHTAPRETDRVSKAFFHGQVAVTQAQQGGREAALRSLRSAERHLEAATSRPGPLAYHWAALAHQRAVVRGLLGDRRGATSDFVNAVRWRPASERRSTALLYARLAEHQLSGGELEQAAVNWHRFLDIYPSIRSGRARSALAVLRARVRPHAAHTSGQYLLARATELWRLPARDL